MVEVFKTDVHDPGYALLIQQLLQTVFVGFEVSFDLEDCDKILRVKSDHQLIKALDLIDFLEQMGVRAEVLSEDVPPPKSTQKEESKAQIFKA
jgi:hypothetical protein